MDVGWWYGVLHVMEAPRMAENGERFQKIGYRFLAEEAFLRTELIDTGRKL